MRTEEENKAPKQEHKPEEAPNETGGIQVDEFIKISDPNSGKVFVAKRGDL